MEAIVFDTTASNTGKWGGSVTLFEGREDYRELLELVVVFLWGVVKCLHANNVVNSAVIFSISGHQLQDQTIFFKSDFQTCTFSSYWYIDNDNGDYACKSN